MVASLRTVGRRWIRRENHAVILLVLLRLVVVVLVIVDVPHFRSAAAGRFHAIVTTPGVPYRDVPVEYPIGELAIIEIVGSSSLAGARVILACLAFAADLTAFASLCWGWGIRVARRYLVVGTPLLIFIYRRSDLVSVALAALAMALIHRSRDRIGAPLLALATLVKLWPGLLLPALLVRRRFFSFLLAVAVLLVGFGAWTALGGVDGITQVTSFRGASGWELESTVGVVVWTLTGERRFESGANRTGTVPGWARAAMLLLLLAGVCAVWFRARRREHDVAGAPALVAVAILLVTSPVLSPQYVSWLLPWGAVAGEEETTWTRLTLAPCCLTGVVMAAWYLNLFSGHPGWSQLALIVRNLSLLLIPIWWFLKESRT